jgi:Cu(I)/Ag(I) efflux system membrane fusion protein
MDFIMQFNDVYDSYIELKNALVESDANKSKQAASKIQQTLSLVDMSLLKGDAHTKWMRMLDNMNLNLKAISSSDAIESQRTSFAGLSDALYAAVKTFGLMGKTAYYQFCPMAKDGKGAYWLSEIKDIQNPYFGKKMIDCGETKETLNY